MSRPPLPELDRTDFEQQLRALSPAALETEALSALWAHYRQLRRWSAALALIGPGTAAEVVGRHYGEALAALPLLPPGPATLVDLGSGAGFPGFVLAAVRRDLAATLVEARARKCAFLRAAARRASLPCRCLNARVGDPLPAGLPPRIDVLTVRALKLGPAALAVLAGRLSPAGSALFWAGHEEPPTPPGMVPGRELALAGSRRRRIVEFRRGG